MSGQCVPFIPLFVERHNAPKLSKISTFLCFGILIKLHRWGIGLSHSLCLHRITETQKNFRHNLGVHLNSYSRYFFDPYKAKCALKHTRRL
jgi:hypothetical protein